MKRILIFLLFAFVLPGMLNFIGPPFVSINTFYPMAFALVASLVFFVSIRKAWKDDNKYEVMQGIVFGALALVMFALYSLATHSAWSVQHIALGLIVGSLLYASYVLFVGLAVFQKVFFRKHLRKILIAGGIVLAYTGLSLLLRRSWEAFSFIVLKVDGFLLNLVYGDVSIDYSVPSMGAGGFSAGVGSPCSGVDSIILFTGLYAIVALLDWDLMDKKKVYKLFAFGVVGAYLMNIVRIFVLYVVGASYDPELAVTLFHTNAGWVLFTGYFFAFMYFAYPKMKK